MKTKSAYVIAALAILTEVVSASAEEIILSCSLTTDASGNTVKNPPELPITVDFDQKTVFLLGGERHENVSISKTTIAFRRGDLQFSINRATGHLDIINQSEPTQHSGGDCRKSKQQF